MNLRRARVDIHHSRGQAADTDAVEPRRGARAHGKPIHCWLETRNLFPIEVLINRGTLKREDTELICVTLTKTALKWAHYFCRPIQAQLNSLFNCFYTNWNSRNNDNPHFKSLIFDIGYNARNSRWRIIQAIT